MTHLEIDIIAQEEYHKSFLDFLINRIGRYNLSGKWGIEPRVHKIYDIVVEDSVRECVSCHTRYATTIEEAEECKLPFSNEYCPKCSGLGKTGKDLLLEDLKGFEAEIMGSDRYGTRKPIRESRLFRWIKKLLPFKLLDFADVPSSQETENIIQARGKQLLVDTQGNKFNVQVIGLAEIEDGFAKDNKDKNYKVKGELL